MKKLTYLMILFMPVSLVLAACTGTPTPAAAPIQAASESPAVVQTQASARPATPAFEAPEGALIAYPTDVIPTLDGVADDEAWANVLSTHISVSEVAYLFSTEATLKAVYKDDMVYFLLSYIDPTESWFRSPWQKQEDGSWKQVMDPNDKGGDNNTAFEDNFSMIWSIDNSIHGFETVGCFAACHVGENPEVKPYGNKYTATSGELGDVWHWKSVSNDGQIDDGYLDWTRFDPKNAPVAGLKDDAQDSGGYVDNMNPDRTAPAFTSQSVDPATGAPGYILDGHKTPLDQAALDALPVGSYIPSSIKSPFVGDRGDISAAWKWADGVWTIEFSRALTTGSETDVQFDDLAAMYYFGLAVFDNAQVRHAFQTGPTPFIFLVNQ